jgi:glycosyltransferase involved in cell wall biosynthesis
MNPITAHDRAATRPEIVSAPASARRPSPATVTIALPCYNEAENLAELHRRLSRVVEGLPGYRFVFLFIDNASTDGSVDVLRTIAAGDPRVSVIVNARNFGHIRSPFHALLEAPGDCVVMMCTDLQDPPELLPEFLRTWEAGAAMAVGQKRTSEESRTLWLARSAFYRIARSIADVDLLEHVTGFGLYDRRAIEIMRAYRDPYPYLRGLIVEIGLPFAVIPYDQPLRRRGITKNNFLTLYDMAMLGFTSHSRLPLRLATMAGFLLAAASLVVAFVFLGLKLAFWDLFPAGYAPAVIGIFFLGSLQIFLVGVLGEYVGAILTQVRGRPWVVESERFGSGLDTVLPNPPADRTP